MAAAGMQEGYLVTEKLVKRFDEALAVDEVSLSIAQGDNPRSIEAKLQAFLHH